MFGFKNLALLRGFAFLSTALLVLSIGAANISEEYRVMLDDTLGTRSYVIETQEVEGDDPLSTYEFLADYENTTELVEAHEALAVRMQEEGTVLLKNENNVLPISDALNITVLGMRGYYPQYGGQIGSTAPAGQNVTIIEALTDAGFNVNDVVANVYTTLGETVTGTREVWGRTVDEFGYRPGALKNSFGVGSNIPSLSINEPDNALLESIDASYAESYADFDDAAIVVVGRPSTEAADFFPGEEGMEDEGARNILGLTTNERAIIQQAVDHFNKVIVLVNSDSAMEIDELVDNPDIDSILWVGAFGNYGSIAIANILKGDANPSGHLADIYASDSTSSPAMQNFGIFEFANTDEIEPEGTTNYRGNWYLVEAEGIYTGYRYYETRYADTVYGNGNADSTAGTFDSTNGWNYSEEVSFPFGYGLSYTTFEQSLDKVTIANNKKTATVTVSVTNTGDVAGKDSVQVYAQTPYIDGGVEKSSVQLMDFAKTSLLEPGDTEIFTFEIDMQLLASYDYQNAQTYILDAGDYYFTLGNGSHDAINNILTYQGYTVSDGMDYNGNEELVFEWTWDEYDDYTFAVSKAGVEVVNQLDDADLNHWLPDTVTYLSRSDWEETWPVSYTDIVATQDMIFQLRNDTYVIQTNDDTSAIIWGAESDLTLSDLKGADFDDYRWEELLNSIDMAEAINTIAFGQNIVLGMDSIGSFDVYVNDGPMGFHGTLSNRSLENSIYFVDDSDPNANYEVRDMPTAVVIGSTFSKDLAREYGLLLGNDSLFNGQSIIWAPGLNLHRTPYNGRNHEYYSEDPVLAGFIASNATLGALDKGLIMAVKHYAFNDQESNRAAVAPLMHEQKARELELRAYQIAFERGTMGTMTSFSRIGLTYVNAHHGLMQDILREEWGFDGYIVTDMINGSQYMTAKESIMASVSLFDTSRTNLIEPGGDWEYMNVDTLSGDAAFQSKMKESLHTLLYTVVNSNAMNGINSSSTFVWQMTWWRAAYISSISVTSLLTLGFSGLYITGLIKNGKRG